MCPQDKDPKIIWEYMDDYHTFYFSEYILRLSGQFMFFRYFRSHGAFFQDPGELHLGEREERLPQYFGNTSVM